MKKIILLFIIIFITHSFTCKAGDNEFKINQQTETFTITDCSQNFDIYLRHFVVGYVGWCYFKVYRGYWYGEEYIEHLVASDKAYVATLLGAAATCEISIAPATGNYRATWECGENGEVGRIEVMGEEGNLSFKVNGSSAIEQNICNNSTIYVDGSASTCINSFWVFVQEAKKTSNGQYQLIGPEKSVYWGGVRVWSWIDIKDLCNGTINFAPNKYYKIKVAFKRSNGFWVEQSKYVHLVSNSSLEFNTNMTGTDNSFLVDKNSNIKIYPGFLYTGESNKHILFKGTSLDCNGDLINKPNGNEQNYDNSIPNYSTLNIERYSESLCNIFPNPTNGIININTNEEFLKIEIKDVFGKTIIQRENVSSSCQFDLSAYPKGIYFVLLYDLNKEVKVNKVVLN